MTKSTITRERLEQLADNNTVCKVSWDERIELAQIALAAMNGEPVAWGNGCDKTVPAALRYLAENERPFGGESRFNAAHLYQLAREIELMAEAPLYRHAQPAPVVPKEKPIPNTLSMYAVDAVAAIAEVKGWNACRAAMLQASPVCTCPSGDGSLRWPCPVHPGNSPAIPDAARDALEKALTAMEFMGDTLNNLDAVCSEDVEFVTPAFDAVRRVLAAAPQEVKGE